MVESGWSLVMISRSQAESALRAYLVAGGPAAPPPVRRPPRAAEGGVALSAQASQVKRWQEVLKNLPDVREDRVAEVRARMEAGEYPPPASDVAAQMLARWLSDRVGANQ